MTARARNRLLALGALWGFLLAAVPVLYMTPGPYRLTGFLVFALICAVLSGCVGTLAAGRRVARSVEEGCPKDGRLGILAGVRVGAVQGLVGGGFAALLFWALMALTTSGFSLQNPVDVSVLLRPQAVLGSFFVALSVFLYALAGGLLLGPIFGLLVRRAVRAGGAGGKEAPSVR